MDAVGYALAAAVPAMQEIPDILPPLIATSGLPSNHGSCSGAASTAGTGKILYTGGSDTGNGLQNKAALYDTSTNTSTIKAVMPGTIQNHTQQELNDGRVWVQGVSASAVVSWTYNPTTNVWTSTGNPPTSPYLTTTTTIIQSCKTPDGFIWAVHGFSAGFARYSQITNTWTVRAGLDNGTQYASIAYRNGGTSIVYTPWSGNSYWKDYNPSTNVWTAWATTTVGGSSSRATEDLVLGGVWFSPISYAGGTTYAAYIGPTGQTLIPVDGFGNNLSSSTMVSCPNTQTSYIMSGDPGNGYGAVWVVRFRKLGEKPTPGRAALLSYLATT